MLIKLFLIIIGVSIIVAIVSSPIFWIIIGVILLISLLNYFINKKKDKISFEEKMKRDKIHNEILEIIFENIEISSRLKEFVLQHTKRYDDNINDIVEYDNYLRKVDLLLVYINNKINSDIAFNKYDFTDEIIEYWNKEKDIIIERDQMKSFIKSKKMRIYSDDLKKMLNIHEHRKIEDIAKEYVDLFGGNGIKDLNLQIFSDSLGENYKDIYTVVNEEYTKVKKEYEMRKLESQLFNSHASYKDMEYIDSLSGFDFEDFLEELFIGFGYTSKELPYSNDYGADLIISKGFNEIVIQAKNYTGNVGNKAVQEVIAAKSYYKCDIGMVITNAYYTQNAIKTAEASEIILVDRDGLERIISEGSIYFNSLVS